MVPQSSVPTVPGKHQIYGQIGQNSGKLGKNSGVYIKQEIELIFPNT